MKYILLFIMSIFASISYAATNPTEKLTVMLDSQPNPDHAPLVIAQQQGYFKEQGLEVELKTPVNPSGSSQIVAANKADIGLSYEPEYMTQVDHGLPLIRIGTLIDKPLNSMVALKDSGINTLGDLKGKKIGTNMDGLSSTMLKTVLAKQGLTEKDVTIVQIKTNLTQALLTHQVDVVTGVMRNVEVPQLEASGHKVTTFFPEDQGVTNYSELVFIANTSHVNDNRFPRFLEAIKKAVAYLDTHPKETWDAFAKHYPQANNDLNRQTWFATMPYFAEDPASFNGKEWKNFAEFMHEKGLIKTIQSESRYGVILRG